MHILGIPVYFIEKAAGFEADEGGGARKMDQNRFSGEKEPYRTYSLEMPKVQLHLKYNYIVVILKNVRS
ncbi:hypothetical protein EO98_17590 [Methanosarcina sp. 2.H.T.1A.6]|nr:hypothetical protein EO97_04275 [Methanosarcina sp. 2.H.T.1A.15]KKG14650.1 hypothetical protein EO94_01660 [Methanosarcina sp. 2.H.T.1A.3]KKG24562.1 hypothetical protein EO98_17590 [Methanosarcina sp. 2.H.T.1A.6]KKG25837.1 hypothetical protein EO96_19630 [Methanosarcina sp. 2.H.T.1A.8]